MDNASRNSFAFDNSGFVGTTTVYSVIPKTNIIEIKYLLAVLNSKVLNYYYKKNTIPQAGGFYRYQALFIKGLPIKITPKQKQVFFTVLVDYLPYLHNKQSDQIFTHTSNERLAAHIEDVLNMMVYELYFEGHMKEQKIDVLQFVNDELSKM